MAQSVQNKNTAGVGHLQPFFAPLGVCGLSLTWSTNVKYLTGFQTQLHITNTQAVNSNFGGGQN